MAKGENYEEVFSAVKELNNWRKRPVLGKEEFEQAPWQRQWDELGGVQYPCTALQWLEYYSYRVDGFWSIEKVEDGPFKASRGELKRWFKNQAVHVDGKAIEAGFQLEHDEFDMVVFPKGKKRRTLWTRSKSIPTAQYPAVKVRLGDWILINPKQGVLALKVVGRGYGLVLAKPWPWCHPIQILLEAVLAVGPPDTYSYSFSEESWGV